MTASQNNNRAYLMQMRKFYSYYFYALFLAGKLDHRTPSDTHNKPK